MLQSLPREEILGCLTDLPVAILEGAAQGGVNLAGAGMGGVQERREGEHGPTSDWWSVRGRREDCIEAAVVADGTEGGHTRLPHEGIGSCCRRQLDQPIDDTVVDALALSTCPGGDFGDGRIGVGQGAEQVDGGVAGGEGRSPPAVDWIDIHQRRSHVVIGGDPQAFEGSERDSAHTGIGGTEPGPSRRRVTLVPRQGDAAARRFDRSLSPSAGSSSS